MFSFINEHVHVALNIHAIPLVESIISLQLRTFHFLENSWYLHFIIFKLNWNVSSCVLSGAE